MFTFELKENLKKRNNKLRINNKLHKKHFSMSTNKIIHKYIQSKIKVVLNDFFKLKK